MNENTSSPNSPLDLLVSRQARIVMAKMFITHVQNNGSWFYKRPFDNLPHMMEVDDVMKLAESFGDLAC